MRLPMLLYIICRPSGEEGARRLEYCVLLSNDSSIFDNLNMKSARARGVSPGARPGPAHALLNRGSETPAVRKHKQRSRLIDPSSLFWPGSTTYYYPWMYPDETTNQIPNASSKHTLNQTLPHATYYHLRPHS